jgi:hypothetical protein
MTTLPLISGSDLPTLGWQHVAQLLLDMIEPVGNNPMKPTGGLWTSPIRDGRTGWTQWCDGENFGTPIRRPGPGCAAVFQRVRP